MSENSIFISPYFERKIPIGNYFFICNSPKSMVCSSGDLIELNTDLFRYGSNILLGPALTPDGKIPREAYGKSFRTGVYKLESYINEVRFKEKMTLENALKMLGELQTSRYQRGS